jgi:hypothetical protein
LIDPLGEWPMTYHDVFVGELFDGPDPLDWGGDWNGNTPNERGPYFPPLGSGKPFWRVQEMIGSGEFPGKQVDWGAWAGRASKAQILKFIEELYGGDDWYRPGSPMPHLYKQFQELLVYVNALRDDKEYALVACEL